MTDFDILLVVPTSLTKFLKDQLEKHGKLDKSTKIRAVNTEADLQDVQLSHRDEKKSCIGKVIIPTTIRWATDGNDLLSASAKKSVLSQIAFLDMPDAMNITLALRPASPAAASSTAASKSPLAQVTATWLSALPVSTSFKLSTQLPSLLSTSSWSYTVYPPMLLLPNSQPWPTLLAIAQPAQLETLYARLCSTFKVTHIALNGPIPLHSSPALMDMLPLAPTTQPAPTQDRSKADPADPADPHPFEESTSPTAGPGEAGVPVHSIRDHQSDAQTRTAAPATTTTTTTTNILRSPTALTPLHGRFGPLLPATHPPTPQDLASAFWCRAQQNGIHQVWAPRYTMFSRGNITEKARILHMAVTNTNVMTVRNKQTWNGHADTAAEPEWSAVDLYAGIGYFAFSYVRRGAAVVLCWEINPWSVEGLRRGARANGWPEATVINSDDADDGARMGKLVVYAEDNRYAAERIERLRPRIPPVRHVNCGFLPTSYPSWQVAVRVLDSLDGGWIHVHENIAVTDIAERARGIVGLIQSYVATTPRPVPEQWTVSCPHIERVKSYAPGVLHCVLDICITPPSSNPTPPAAP